MSGRRDTPQPAEALRGSGSNTGRIRNSAYSTASKAGPPALGSGLLPQSVRPGLERAGAAQPPAGGRGFSLLGGSLAPAAGGALAIRAALHPLLQQYLFAFMDDRNGVKSGDLPMWSARSMVAAKNCFAPVVTMLTPAAPGFTPFFQKSVNITGADLTLTREKWRPVYKLFTKSFCPGPLTSSQGRVIITARRKTSNTLGGIQRWQFP